jgi:arylsulfatase A-like enzyme
MAPGRALVALTLSFASGCGQSPMRTDVVLIVVDTLRADALQNPERTPALTRLGDEGVRFSEAFAHVPLTLPSHTVLFSSRLPGRSGVRGNGRVVRETLPLLAPWLAEQGWRTQAVTSLATLWPAAVGEGLDRGFELYPTGPDDILLADEITRRALALLDESERDAGTLLFVHYSDPHEPYTAHGTVTTEARVELDGSPLATIRTSELRFFSAEVELAAGEHELRLHADDAFRLRACRLHSGENEVLPTWSATDPRANTNELVGHWAVPTSGAGIWTLRLWIQDAPDLEEIRRRYALEVQAVDRAVGELLDGLRQRGLYDSALIVFTSDHGEGLGEHGSVGHGRLLYDELLHVPLMIKLPLGDPRESDLRATAGGFARHVDLVPTLTQLLNLEAFPGAQGRSLLEGGPRTLLAEAHPPEAPRDLYALSDGRFKLIHDPDQDLFELYDLEQDPEELTNIFGSGERFPDWQERLHRAAREQVLESAPPDVETLRRLEGLGY